MAFKKDFLRNVLISGGYNYLIQVITFFSSLITSRLLFPESYGLVGLITVFSGFITIFSDSGLSYSIIRSEYGYTYHKGLFNLSWIIGIMLCVITLLLIYPITLFYGNPKILLPGIAISFLFLIRSFSIVPAAVLQKRLDFSYLGKANLISIIISIFFTILLALLGFQHWALIWPQYFASVALFIILWQKVKLPVSMNLALIKKSFIITKKLISSVLGFNVINYWSRNVDNLLVGKMYGTADLGIYNRAYQMLTLPLTLISGLFSSVLYPSLINLRAKGGDVQKEYYFVLKLISIINLPVGFLLILFSRDVVLRLWGNSWISVAPLLPYFGLLILTQTLMSTLGSYLILSGREKIMMLTGWVSAAFLVSGIVVGAFISLEKIAAFYALSFILFSLPFTIFYAYIYSLKQPLHLVLSFWLPKFIISVVIWISLFFANNKLLYISVAGWALSIFFDIKNELYIAVFKKNLSKRVIAIFRRSAFS